MVGAVLAFCFAAAAAAAATAAALLPGRRAEPHSILKSRPLIAEETENRNRPAREPGGRSRGLAPVFEDQQPVGPSNPQFASLEQVIEHMACVGQGTIRWTGETASNRAGD